MSAIASEEHPLLTARHVDDLTDAVRALTRQLLAGAQHYQESLDMQRRQLEVLRSICESTDALREVIVKQRTNGNAHTEEAVTP